MRFSVSAILLSLVVWVFPPVLLAQETSGPDVVELTESKSPSVATVSELSDVPVPAISARAWVAMDANSGQVIAAHDINERIEPASLTKIMAAYLVFEALENGRLALDQMVHVSEKAWRTEGSRMFIEPNTDVSIDDLLKGVIVQSGNDATVALAEAVSGSESAFVALMNKQAAALNLQNTHYTNSSGLPDPDHYTSVQDLALLARALVQRFPQYLHYYSQKEFTYNKISQANRNRLLWADETVDGLKTGHTQSAGYCLVTTALRDGRRVIAVVVGEESDAARTESSLTLLNWSFQNFDMVKLLDVSKPAIAARVWEGESTTANLGVLTDLWVTVPQGRADDIASEARYTKPLLAPLEAGQRVGTLVLSLDDQILRQVPLEVQEAVAQSGLFGRLIDKLRLLFD